MPLLFLQCWYSAHRSRYPSKVCIGIVGGKIRVGTGYPCSPVKCLVKWRWWWWIYIVNNFRALKETGNIIHSVHPAPNSLLITAGRTYFRWPLIQRPLEPYRLMGRREEETLKSTTVLKSLEAVWLCSIGISGDRHSHLIRRPGCTGPTSFQSCSMVLRPGQQWRSCAGT